MSFGVIPEGFNRKLVDDLLVEIENDERAGISPLLNLLPSSVFGQMNGIFANRLRELWEVAQATYNAFNPDQATGAGLDALAAITGAVRLEAAPSTVQLSVELEAGTTLTVGRLVASSVTGEQFTTTEEVTNPGPGTVFLTVAAESVNAGEVAAPAGVLTVIASPVSGWLSVTNTLDADLGREIEADDDFRARREELLRSTGAGTLEAVRAAVRAVDGVTEAFVFENTTLLPDSFGLPGKAFEAVVDGGVPAAIADAVFLAKPLGIESFGSTEVIVTDSQGFPNSIKFSRPVAKLVYVDCQVQVDPALYPIDGDAQVEAALAAEGDSLVIGEDVTFVRFQCIPLQVPGVLDVLSYVQDPAGSTTDSTTAPTWALSGGETLDLLLNSEVIRQVVFQPGDFAVPGAATALEVIARIEADIGAEIDATTFITFLRLVSVAGGSVLVQGGTSNAAFVFPTTIVPVSTANIQIGGRQLAKFDTSRINVTSVPV